MAALLSSNLYTEVPPPPDSRLRVPGGQGCWGRGEMRTGRAPSGLTWKSSLNGFVRRLGHFTTSHNGNSTADASGRPAEPGASFLHICPEPRLAGDQRDARPLVVFGLR
ncbi:unnamed protein product [Pleuronectes platessa]|uniref:Uncharacterized protein n=1 Tax=Pleuronectes platessa TaxID=8262 RepID=A0A9N7VMG9_PLEPL|nr:unnamed protein product [Pleuronectes platessa]